MGSCQDGTTTIDRIKQVLTMSLSEIPVEQAMLLLPEILRPVATQLLAQERKTSLIVFQEPGAPEGKGIIWDIAARGMFFGLFT